MSRLDRLSRALVAIDHPEAKAAILSTYDTSPGAFHSLMDVVACLVAARADLVSSKKWFDAVELRILLQMLLPGFTAMHLLVVFSAFNIPVRVHSADHFDVRFNCRRLFAELRDEMLANLRGQPPLLAVLDRASAYVGGVALERGAKIKILLEDIAATSAPATTISTDPMITTFDRTAN